MRFVPFNGAPTSTQIEWLKERLLLSRRQQQRCVIFSHMPIYRPCCRPMGLMWGAEQVRLQAISLFLSFYPFAFHMSPSNSCWSYCTQKNIKELSSLLLQVIQYDEYIFIDYLFLMNCIQGMIMRVAMPLIRRESTISFRQLPCKLALALLNMQTIFCFLALSYVCSCI